MNPFAKIGKWQPSLLKPLAYVIGGLFQFKFTRQVRLTKSREVALNGLLLCPPTTSPRVRLRLYHPRWACAIGGLCERERVGDPPLVKEAL